MVLFKASGFWHNILSIPGPSTENPLRYPVANHNGDPTGIIPQDLSLHELQQVIIDGVDQPKALDVGLGGK